MPPPLPRILIATPVKNAARQIPRYVANLRRLTYPHALLSIAFLESDSDDGSFDCLASHEEILRRELRGVTLMKHDFGYRPPVGRHAPEIQRERRAVIARSRNRLVQRALTDEDHVLWIDADVVDHPPDVIEALLRTGRDIVVPNCIGPDGRTFDLNTFKFKPGAREQDWTPFVRDGIVQPPAGEGRLYLDDLRDHAIVQVDSVGGAMLLVRADLHRDGLVFPAFSYGGYIETEGLAMMAADMGYACWGLPGLTIAHA